MKTRACIVTAIVALGLGACGEPEAPPAPPAETIPAPAPETEPPAAAEPVVPADPAARGAVVYASFCATCHGAHGDGDGPASADLDPKPARHSDAAYMDSLSDEYLTQVIAEGGAAVGKSPLMPGWQGAIGDAEIRDVVAFIRTLSR